MNRRILRAIAGTLSAVLLTQTGVFAQAPAAATAQNPISSFLPLIVIFGIFYFLIIMPQQKKTKEHQKMLNALKKDDKIITSGGIFATVANVKGDTVEVKIAEGVKIQVLKSAISTILKPEPNETHEKVIEGKV
jgi:preprotein translocase subunit YajC